MNHLPRHSSFSSLARLVPALFVLALVVSSAPAQQAAAPKTAPPKVSADIGQRRFDTEALPLKGRSTSPKPVGHTIYLQMPLNPKPIHWMFANKEDLLSGKFEMSITRAGQVTKIPIFESGALDPGWEIIPFPPPAGVTGTYYCFRTKPDKKIETAVGDLYELEFTTPKDLEGQGPLFAGKLPAGTYKAKGFATAIFDDFDPIEAREALKSDHSMNEERKQGFLAAYKRAYDFSAILDSWSGGWSLTITKPEGWLPPEKAEELKKIVAARRKAEGRKD